MKFEAYFIFRKRKREIIDESLTALQRDSHTLLHKYIKLTADNKLKVKSLYIYP
jgi:hypothetical protein